MMTTLDGQAALDYIVNRRGKLDASDLVWIIHEADVQLSQIVLKNYRLLVDKGPAGQRTKSP